MIAIILLPLYIILNLYVCRWFMKWLNAVCNGHLAKPVRIIIHIVYWTLCLSMYIAALIPSGDVKKYFNIVGTFWYGVVIYVLINIGLFDLVRVIVKKIKKKNKNEYAVSRCSFILIGCLCLAIIITVSIYGAVNARTIKTTHQEVNIEKDGNGISSLNAVLIADLHMGYSVNSSMIKKMVDKINAENPDIVFIAGDIFDNEYDALDNPAYLEELFKSIHTKYGIYAVYGNHDIEEKIIGGFSFPSKEKKMADERMDKFLEDCGIVNLRDEGVLVADSFFVYGRPDADRLGRGIDRRKTPDEIANTIDTKKPIIVLDHVPRELEELSRSGVDLDLSGHTHDGQIFPLNIIALFQWMNPHGECKVGNMTNITTSGVGFYGPSLRVGTDAEICQITINFKE